MKSALPALQADDRRLNVLGGDGVPRSGEGEAARINVAFTDLRATPDKACGIDTQLLFGETLRVFDSNSGWSLVQADRDRYVGWLEDDTLSFDGGQATHLIAVPRTFFYPGPDLKLPHKGMRSMGSEIRVMDYIEARGTRYAMLETGEAVVERHIRPIEDHAQDYVAVAERLVSTPYLWAGTTAFGLDCSGLVKLAMHMCGRPVLRDSDMQAATIGTEIDPGIEFINIARGDLVFWRGHVAIAQGKNQEGVQMMLHANGHTMDVASEPLLDAVDRIAYLYEHPIGVRRP